MIRKTTMALAASALLVSAAGAETVALKDTNRRLVGYVYAQQPLPGMTLVQQNIKTEDGETPGYCYFLVRGTPADVKAGKVQPADVVQMSCQRHYVRTTKSSTFWR